MRCFFCHTEQSDLVETGYYDPVVKHDTIVYGCRDIEACMDRQPKFKHYKVDLLIATKEGK